MSNNNEENSYTVSREVEHLVSMANDIAINLSFHEDASVRTADHINKYWAPRMRSLLLEYAKAGGQELSQHVQPALKLLRE